MSWSCVWQAKALLGEGPLWWPEQNGLLFVDIKRPAILAWFLDGRTAHFPLPSEIGCLVHQQHGGFLAAMREGICRITLDPWSYTLCVPLEQEIPGNRFNDGKCDPQGRLWAASMDDAVLAPSGQMWRIGPDLTAVCMGGGHIVGNGFGWSPDGGTMYFTDSENRTIFAYDFHGDDGSLRNRRIFAQVPGDKGYPDGLTVDAEGGVWSAHWDGGCVTRYRPTGQVDRVISLPVPRPTSLAFGGEKLDRLFVTSASIGLNEQQLADAPLSGSLFDIEVEVPGRPEPRFICAG